MGKKYVTPSMKVKEIKGESLLQASEGDGEEGGDNAKFDFSPEEESAKSNHNTWTDAE